MPVCGTAGDHVQPAVEDADLKAANQAQRPGPSSCRFRSGGPSAGFPILQRSDSMGYCAVWRTVQADIPLDIGDDDHPRCARRRSPDRVAGDLCRLLFERQPYFTVLASFTDTESALAGVRSSAGCPGVDLRTARAERPGSASDDGRRTPGLPFVLLTANILDEELVEAMKLGVTGVVLKESPTDALLDCIRQVHKGLQWIDRDMASRALRSAGMSGAGPLRAAEALTPRELEIGANGR